MEDPQRIGEICKQLGIHRLAVQDLLDQNQRPKFQEYEDFSFLTLKSLVPKEQQLLTEQISFIFRPNFMISFQKQKASYFEHLRKLLKQQKGVLRER